MGNVLGMGSLSEIGKVWRVASFVEGVLEGNPAGVWVGEVFPGEGVMQAAAAELGYSETAFVVPDGGGDGAYRIRYFTPEVEVALCGHATLAAAEVLWEGGHESSDVAVVMSAAGGELEVMRGGDGVIWMDFPAELDRRPVLGGDEGMVLETLGLKECEGMWRGEDDLFVELADERRVMAYRTEGSRIGELEVRGVCVTAAAARGRDYDFVSRFFAPRCGIAEDPVTGSAHRFLGPLWVTRTGRFELVGYQASERGGWVRVRWGGGERVEIGGRAVVE